MWGKTLTSWLSNPAQCIAKYVTGSTSVICLLWLHMICLRRLYPWHFLQGHLCHLFEVLPACSIHLHLSNSRGSSRAENPRSLQKIWIMDELASYDPRWVRITGNAWGLKWWELWPGKHSSDHGGRDRCVQDWDVRIMRRRDDVTCMSARKGLWERDESDCSAPKLLAACLEGAAAFNRIRRHQSEEGKRQKAALIPLALRTSAILQQNRINKWNKKRTGRRLKVHRCKSFWANRSRTSSREIPTQASQYKAACHAGEWQV